MNFESARFNMTEQQVRPWQVLDLEILSQMNALPRHLFVPEAYLSLAYADTEIPLNDTAAMLSPKVVGRILQSIKLTPHDEVLQIGTGTGYLTALMAKLSAKVHGLEINKELSHHTATHLHDLGIQNVVVERADAFHRAFTQRTFDVIVFTGSMAFIPKNFLDMLSEGGRLFAFTGQAPTMHAMLVQKVGPNFITTDLFETRVARLLNAPEAETFVF